MEEMKTENSECLRSKVKGEVLRSQTEDDETLNV